MLDPFLLKQLVNVSEKNLISGRYGFITCAIFQAAGLLNSVQRCVCAHVLACVSERYEFDCVMETFHLIFLIFFFSLTQKEVAGWRNGYRIL